MGWATRCVQMKCIVFAQTRQFIFIVTFLCGVVLVIGFCSTSLKESIKSLSIACFIASHNNDAHNHNRIHSDSDNNDETQLCCRRIYLCGDLGRVNWRNKRKKYQKFQQLETISQICAHAKKSVLHFGTRFDHFCHANMVWQNVEEHLTKLKPPWWHCGCPRLFTHGYWFRLSVAMSQSWLGRQF